MDKNDVPNFIDSLIEQNKQKLEASSEKVRQKRRNQPNQRLQEKGPLDNPYQCRLCLAIQISGLKFTSTNLPEISTALSDMFGINVGKVGRIWDRFSKICYRCKAQLEQSYKFYCQVISTETYLANILGSEPKRQKVSPEWSSNQDGSVTESVTDDIEIMEYVEDHTQYESNNGESYILDPENNVDLTLDDQSNDDEDLDFDFTDDEKDEKEEEEECLDTEVLTGEVSNTEVDSETVVAILDAETNGNEKTEEDESPEHTKMVNLLLDSGVNGIESEIDCCLIDKKTLMTHEGQVSEQVTLVLRDQYDPPLVDPPSHREEAAIPKPKPRQTGKRTSIHEAEYIVCEKCQTIYHRPMGSDSKKCLTCIARAEKREAVKATL